jgi:flagellar biosynthesis/type III secretory pathway protein FliH
VQSSVHRLSQNLASTEVGLRKGFGGWLQDVILPRFRLTEQEVAARRTLEEVESMLAESIDRWNRELLEKGRQEGLEAGRQQGARLVLRQLRLKFGPLEAETEERVRSADSDRLLEWGERVVTAATLQEVFRD